jgi:CRISPR-associated endoribonuclease Cas6
MDMAELGVLSLVISPEANCSFGVTTARLLNAALLRRIELVDPALSAALHDTPAGASSVEKPWTISPLTGLIQKNKNHFVAAEKYPVRITALNSEVMQALASAFDPEHPIGREPLLLGGVPFSTLLEQSGWENLATYASLLTISRPLKDIVLEFNSPTGFRTQNKTTALPEPHRCIAGYLRKWNTFSNLAMQTEPILKYITNHLVTECTELEPSSANFGEYYQRGWVGRVKWRADVEISFLLRMVNALVNYSVYCGTGMKTAMGMGQTKRIN